MKLLINKKFFLSSWAMAERSTSTNNTVSALNNILLEASGENVLLKATDVKTAIICNANGVSVQEPGEVLFPVKMVSELFKKIEGEEFSLEEKNGKIIVKAEKSKYTFPCYPTKEFPVLKTSEGATFFAKITAIELSKVLEEGAICASPQEEYPLYLSSVLVRAKNNGIIDVVSTDSRRLALSKETILTGPEAEEESALLPMKTVKDLLRILQSLPAETEINLFVDQAQFYFKTENLEYSIRKVDSKFPSFERIIPQEYATTTICDRLSLISALERVDVIVRDFTKTAIINISPEEQKMTLRGKAPDFGIAKEEVQTRVEGEALTIGVNSKFFLEALRVIREENAVLQFNGPTNQIGIKREDSDNFLCLIAPINLTEEDLVIQEEE